MGAEPWEYFVPYESDVRSAMQKLQERVLASGDFNGGELKPSSIEEAVENADADGTRSILDMTDVGDASDIGTLGPLPLSEVQRIYGTTQPTREMIEENMDFYENLDRGQGVYIVVYNDGKPSEYFFGGYSFD